MVCIIDLDNVIMFDAILGIVLHNLLRIELPMFYYINDKCCHAMYRVRIELKKFTPTNINNYKH